MSDLLSNEALMDVAFAALDHGVDSIEHGGPLIPFVMWRPGRAGRCSGSWPITSGTRSSTAFACSLRCTADAHIAAIVRTRPSWSIPGTRADAVIVEFYERGGAHSGLLGQRFVPGEPERALERVGNPAFLGEQDPLF